MFNTQENECVGFESKWKVKKVYEAGSSQTTEYSLKDIETNTATTAEIETQTEADEVDENPQVDMQKLADWLKRIYPSVKRELDEANNSQAFKNYHPCKGGFDAQAKMLQSVQVYSDEEAKVALPISAVSWSSSGRTLAVTCKHAHKSWCYHTGVVYLYTFDKNDQLPDIPTKKLTADACVVVIKFHPNLPNILAAGTYSGDIVIWNTQHDDTNSVVCKENGHEQGPTQISWIHDIDPAKTVLLATSSLDGFLNLWNFNSAVGSLAIKQKYNIKSPIIPRHQRKNETPEEILNKVARGVICFDFSPHVPDMFLVGVEGGLVVQCSMLGASPLKGSTKEIPISDPVYKYYQPHELEITSINFSPNRKEMFMSTGLEGEIYVYIIDQDEPAQVIFLEKPLNVLCWVPFEEKIVCGGGIFGCPEIFNLISGRPIPIAKEKNEASILTMDINRKRPTTLAIGNNKGYIQIFNMPWNSFSQMIQ